MGDHTSIEWTDATWNPVRGCSRVSPGCEHCYAELLAARFSGAGQAYEGLARRRSNGQPQWTGTVALIERHLKDPVRWKEPRRIFVNSMSDLFHEGLAWSQIAQVFAVMALAPQHIYQVLTKRPRRMLEAMRTAAFEIAVDQHADELAGAWGVSRDRSAWRWPLPTVWLGVSVEDQERADERIPLLLDTPAAVRFISAEPLLGSVDLRPRPRSDLCIRCGQGPAALHQHPDGYRTRGLDWVIVGGESGPRARPMHPGWARQLRDQCQLAGVPLFFKQWGAFAPIDVVDGDDPDGRSVFALPDGTVTGYDWNGGPGPHLTGAERLLRCSKASQKKWMALQAGVPIGGALLDGREWSEFPAVAS